MARERNLARQPGLPGFKAPGRDARKAAGAGREEGVAWEWRILDSIRLREAVAQYEAMG